MDTGHDHAALIEKTKATGNKRSTLRAVFTAKTDSLNMHHSHTTQNAFDLNIFQTAGLCIATRNYSIQVK